MDDTFVGENVTLAVKNLTVERKSETVRWHRHSDFYFCITQTSNEVRLVLRAYSSHEPNNENHLL